MFVDDDDFGDDYTAEEAEKEAEEALQKIHETMGSARKPSPEHATCPNESERAHMVTICLDTTCVGGGPAPTLELPTHAPARHNA